MQEFSATECIKFGWETFKKRPWFLVGAHLLYVAVVVVVSVVLGEIGKTGSALNFVASITSWVFQLFAGMGMIAFLIKAHDDIEHVALKDFWRPDAFWKYLGAVILVFLAFVGGLILLIIPGIIFSIMFGFATYLVIDRGLRPMEAMRESRRITEGHKGELFSLALLSLGVFILGLICLLVGILVAIPVTALAFVHAYRTLSTKTSTPEPVA